MTKQVLYVSYDGMTDPLGQSQVIPYLAGLSKNGHNITLLSTEKQENYTKHHQKIKRLLADNNINWQPVFYTKKPPVISTIKDVITLKRKARKLHKTHQFNVVHCRSYISAFVGVFMKRKFGCKFLFDMRGFWPDERVDGNIWNLKNPVYKLVYHYFKTKEKLFLNFSDAIVSLTQAGKTELLKWNLPKVNDEKISIIPCCADFNHFDFHKIKPEQNRHWRKKLHIPDNYYVLNYLGSVGTWYMMDEMLEFFVQLKKRKPESIFLFITRDNPDEILKAATNFGIAKENIRIQGADRNEIPGLIKSTDASIFFIKPVWSKKASSPTKMAELMGLGIPIVANSNIGDVNEVMEQNPSGILVNSFTEHEYSIAAEKLLAISNTKQQDQVRNLACDYFSLDKGISTFDEIYQKISD